MRLKLTSSHSALLDYKYSSGYDFFFTQNVSGMLGLGFNSDAASRVRHALAASSDARNTDTGDTLSVFSNPAASNLQRWLVSVDAISLGGRTVQTKSSYADAPGGQALAWLDTGTSYAELPRDVWTAPYSTIPGAMPLNGRFGAIADRWLVPCTPRISVAFVLGYGSNYSAWQKCLSRYRSQTVFADPNRMQSAQMP